MICGSKYNPKLSKVCKICNNSLRKGVGRVEFKNEWYKNWHLMIKRTDHVSTLAETVCSTCEDSD